MNRFTFLAALTVGLSGLMAAMGCGGGGSGSRPEPTPTPPTLAAVSDNYNPRVGHYEGTGTLPDGRSLRWDIVAGADALLSGRMQLGSSWAALERSRNYYNLKNGTLELGEFLTYSFPGGESIRFLGNIPISNSDGSKPFRAAKIPVYYKKSVGSPEEVVEMSVARRTSVLGTEDRLTLTNRSADCNAALGPVVFEYLETKYEVPDTKNGFFSAFGQLTQSNFSRRFDFLIRTLERGQLTGTVGVGQKITFPTESPVQVQYYEDAPDGTIKAWKAVSGTVVFDAVDISLPISAINGEAYQTTGKVSFHFENLRMEAANSVSDPRFVGAQGSFTLEYAGTSTVGYKRYSRDW